MTCIFQFRQHQRHIIISDQIIIDLTKRLSKGSKLDTLKLCVVLKKCSHTNVSRITPRIITPCVRSEGERERWDRLDKSRQFGAKTAI